ncbi:hypothetical protein F2Q68_00040205 [Brassica cretica]|uniref:Response regulatory domain-containing protein n=1 Tax=Brassica cretica TaxID=69181 RepID=A0A8S9MSN4_BRACR|nr:hypothetical protein F2Q68_00040205 [Brassica cretica]
MLEKEKRMEIPEKQRMERRESVARVPTIMCTFAIGGDENPDDDMPGAGPISTDLLASGKNGVPMSSKEVSNAVLVEVCPGEGTKPSDISVVTEVSEEPQDVDMQRRHALSKLAMEQDFEALDQFPVRMRVIAVDDDQTCLCILETLLHRCHYHVTTMEKAQTALELLKDNKNKFNLVISDVDMPHMDGFKLLELLGLEMDLPIILLSAHSHPKYVMEGVKRSACDYLLKSVRIEELKNIWQHMVRKSMFKNMKNILTNGESQGNSDQNGLKANRKHKDQLVEQMKTMIQWLKISLVLFGVLDERAAIQVPSSC